MTPDAAQEVGGGHSSEEGKDNKTCRSEGPLLEPSFYGRRDRVTAHKAQRTPIEKVRVLQRKLYRAAKVQPKPIRARPEARLEQRFDDDAYRGLRHAILDARDAQRSLPPIGLGDEHTPHRLRPVALFEQFRLKFTEELLHSPRRDGLDGFAVDPRRAAIAAHLLPRNP
jgi:hypothetical protein